MVKKMRRIFTALLCTALIFTLAFAALGEEALYVNLEAGDIRDGRMYVMLNTNAMQMPDRANTVVTLDDSPLEITDVNKFSTSGMKTSYMLLVDISGSVTQQGLKAEKAVANGILNLLGGFDNMAVMLLGESIEVSEFSSDKAALKAQIDALKVRPKENTSVFGGIYQALDILASSSEVHERRCLIVVTDGCDTVEGGYTYEDTLKRIESAHVPLHVAALVFDRPRAEAKKLEALATASPGGTTTFVGINGVTGKDAANAVKSVNDRAFVLTCSLENIIEESTAAALSVKMTVNGEQAGPDTIAVDTSGKLVLPAEVAQTPTNIANVTPADATPANASPADTTLTDATLSNTTTTDATPADAPAAAAWLDGTWFPPTGTKLYIVIGAAVIIAAVAIAIIAAGKKRKRRSAYATTRGGTTLDPAMLSGASGRVLKLTRLGMRENEDYVLPFAASIIVGSDPSASQLVFHEDVRLSPAHCAFDRDGAGVSVRDLNSATMTFVNGVPIRAPKRLNKGDEVILGAYRFRVDWN